MSRIANNVMELIGNTPLVRVSKLNEGKAEILVKAEFFNPGSSVKDRIGFALIEDAEKSGRLKILPASWQTVSPAEPVRRITARSSVSESAPGPQARHFS